MVLSIIIPVYKVEKYLHKCVNSILQVLSGQEKLYEIILVNDGSPDNCGKICDEYKKNHKHINVIHQKNSGPSVARNTGLENATGNFVTFIDSDDWVDADMAKLIPLIQEHPDVDVFINSFQKLDEGGTVVATHDEIIPNETFSPQDTKNYMRFLKSVCTTKFWGTVWRQVFKKDFIIENGLYFDPSIVCGEDEHLTIRTILSGATYRCLGLNFNRYLIREGSICNDNTRKLKNMYDGINCYTDLINLINKNTTLPKLHLMHLQKHFRSQLTSILIQCLLIPEFDIKSFKDKMKQNNIKLRFTGSWKTNLAILHLKTFGYKWTAKVLRKLFKNKK